MIEVIIALLAFGAGIGIGMAFGRSRGHDAAKRDYESRMADRERMTAELDNQKERLHREALDAQRSANREALESMQQRFDETVARMKAELETATSEMLRKRQAEFSDSSRAGMADILRPLNENLEQMKKAVSENTQKHSEMGGQLAGNIRLVLEHSDAARKSADKLADALRGGGKIQGDWGETVLTELLESQGLSEGVHYDTQATLRDAAGNAVKGEGDSLLRPDVILHLDNRRDVIIDAKVSLSAYLDFMNADTDEARSVALKNHITSLEAHVKELSRKNYAGYVLPPKVRMDYVIMFVPNTSALHTAVARKPDLWRRAMEKNVYIADEQTLYAALRIIDMTWRQIAQAENHEKVFALAQEMLDRVGMFMEKFAGVGRKLEDARKSYEDAFAKIRDTGQSIPQTCRKLVKLGAKTTPRKGVDPALVGMADTDGGQ